MINWADLGVEICSTAMNREATALKHTDRIFPRIVIGHQDHQKNERAGALRKPAGNPTELNSIFFIFLTNYKKFQLIKQATMNYQAVDWHLIKLELTDSPKPPGHAGGIERLEEYQADGLTTKRAARDRPTSGLSRQIFHACCTTCFCAVTAKRQFLHQSQDLTGISPTPSIWRPRKIHSDAWPE